MKLLIKLAIVIALCFGSEVYAKQIVKVKEDGEIKVWVSSVELNRIKAIDDRVKYIRGNEGDIEWVADKEIGDLYIKPKVPEVTNIFITTEKGYTYKILLQVHDMQAEQIFLKNEDAMIKEASKEKVGVMDEREEAAALIKEMRAGRKLIGYVEIENNKSSKSSSTKKGYSLGAEKIYKGENLICEKILIKAKRKLSKEIREEEFFGKDVVAVSMDRVIRKNEQGYVYIVKRVNYGR